MALFLELVLYFIILLSYFRMAKRKRPPTLTVLLLGVLAGWILHGIVVFYSKNTTNTSTGSLLPTAIVSTNQPKKSHGGPTGTDSSSLSKNIFSKRPKWETGYPLEEWLPTWLPDGTIDFWKSLANNETHWNILYNKDATTISNEERDAYFFDYITQLTSHHHRAPMSPIAVAIANNGFGHRLLHLSLSYLCNIVPNQRLQLVFWDTPPIRKTDHKVWSELFDDSPVLHGVPWHWMHPQKYRSFDKITEYRELTNTTWGNYYPETAAMNPHGDSDAGDYNMYFDLKSSGGHCDNIRVTADTWLLRIASEPSVQEFYKLLRAQLKARIKKRIDDFMSDNFPTDKLVIGLHVRSGNGHDDGQGHFDKVERGTWLKNMTAAVLMMRKHVRYIAHSILDRYQDEDDMVQLLGADLNQDQYDEILDGGYRIFIASDSQVVIDEFKRQHDESNIIALTQDRMASGVPINTAMECNGSQNSFQCQLKAEEAMLIDAFLLGSCDALLSESYSNFMYTLPATLTLAEGRIFCQSGRAALGGKYVYEGLGLLGEAYKDTLLGRGPWLDGPPPSDAMPVRCQQSSWAARDRFHLHESPDVLSVSLL